MYSHLLYIKAGSKGPLSRCPRHHLNCGPSDRASTSSDASHPPPFYDSRDASRNCQALHPRQPHPHHIAWRSPQCRTADAFTRNPRWRIPPPPARPRAKNSIHLPHAARSSARPPGAGRPPGSHVPATGGCPLPRWLGAPSVLSSCAAGRLPNGVTTWALEHSMTDGELLWRASMFLTRPPANAGGGGCHGRARRSARPRRR